MLTHPTIDKLHRLRLPVMVQGLRELIDTPSAGNLSFEERLGLLADRELLERENKKLVWRLAKSRIGKTACLEDIDYRASRLLASWGKMDLLLLDDPCLLPLTQDQRSDLLEILEDRWETRSTLVTSQYPVDLWHERIGEPTLADAILDRLVHNAYTITLKGDSMRKRLKT